MYFTKIYNKFKLDSFIGENMFEWIIVILALLAMSIRINQQWEESVVLRLGRYNRKTKAGIFLKIPFIERKITIDRRIITQDITRQEVITKDNISVQIDAVVFYKVKDVDKAVINIENYKYSIRLQSQATMRDIVGEYELDELLEKRDEIAKKIKLIVDKKTDEWGIDIDQIKLQNIELPEAMKRVMARQAEAEREKRAVIIKSQGELEAATNLKKASDEMQKSKYAIELRKLSTISDVSQDQSNTIVFAVPIEAMNSAMAASSGLKVPKPITSKKR